MTQEAQSLITDEMRASIGREGPPGRHEVDKTGIRMFARAVGHTDQIFYDEDHARSKGYRSLVCPPGYLGTAVFNPAASRPGAAQTGRRTLNLNGGNEYEYTGVAICAGDVLTSVAKVVSIDEVTTRRGPMLVTRRETTYTNQDGEVVCRSYNTGLQYP
jgi:hypothetical protein